MSNTQKIFALVWLSVLFFLFGLGVKLTYADVISTADVVQTQVSRNLGTLYQNTSGTALFVSFEVTDAVTTNALVQCYSSSVNSISASAEVSRQHTGTAGASGYTTCAFYVPNLWYYDVTSNGASPVVNNVVEWRISTTTNASTTISIGTIDNTNQDYFNGLLLFFGMIYFVVWFFRKK